MVDIRWAFLTVPILAVVFLTLGYALNGQDGLRADYNTFIANIPVYLALYGFSIFLLIVWFRTAGPRQRTVMVRRVRAR